MQETGMRNAAFGADKFGFDSLAAVHWNLSAPQLYERAMSAGEAQLAFGGALAADTGVHTGRPAPAQGLCSMGAPLPTAMC